MTAIDPTAVGSFGWLGGTTIIRPGIDTSTFNSILVMNCTIERNRPVANDEAGDPIENWEDLATAVDCLLQPYSVMDIQKQEIDTAKTVVERLNLSLKGSQDVTVKDRISAIIYTGDSSSVAVGPLYIKEVNKSTDIVSGVIFHIECILSRKEGS